MKIGLAQLNPLIGDLAGNGELIKSTCMKASKLDTDLLITPELSLWGYPPRDLLLNQSLLDKQKIVLEELVNTLAIGAPHLKLLVGIAEAAQDAKLPKLFNSIALVQNNGWEVVARKQLLPTYDVFDEKRYFRSAQQTEILEFQHRGKLWQLGLTICEDLWVEEDLQGHQLSGPDPIEDLLPHNVDLLINFSASPFCQHKSNLRKKLASSAAQRLKCPVIYLNQIGGNDELVFDGASFIIDQDSQLLLKLPSFQETFSVWDTHSIVREPIKAETSEEQQLFEVLVLGVHDYAMKCGFKTALIGLSGGIDSALVTVIAAAALGPSQITTMLMPSPWSSQGSINDAKALADRLGIIHKMIPITPLMESFTSSLTKPLGKPPEGVTAENLQSRIRGTLLMAMANQQGHLLLSTGNKSELAVGYCTLYGDMNGGLAVIGDIYKSTVFSICHWLDSPAAQSCRIALGLPASGELIGKAIRHKPPSAELSPNQLDTDSLPDYSVLDPILKSLIEDKISKEELIKKGQDPALLDQIQKLIQRGEFKRRQAPPLLKVTPQAFGSGWRVPIAAV